MSAVRRLWNRRLDLRWDLSASEIEQSVAVLEAKHRQVQDSVAQTALEAVDVGNTLQPLADCDAEATTKSIELVLPAFCASDNPETRKASATAKATLKKMWTSAFQRADVYERLEALKKSSALKLETQTERYLNRMLKLYERHGCALSPMDRSQLGRLREREADLCGQIEQTINEDNSFVTLSKAELDGVDELNRFTPGAEPDTFNIDLKAPQALPVLTQAHSPVARKKVEEARVKRCPENRERFQELLHVRHEAARLLGFPSHSAYMNAMRMMGTHEAAYKFVDDLLEQLAGPAHKDRDEMLAMNRALGHTADVQLWDLRYLSNRLQQKHFGIDESLVRKYFPLEHVLKEIMAIYAELLSVRYEKITDDATWHPDVEFYAVHDKSSDEVLGYFFLDLFPRPGKYSHQCVLPIRPSCRRQGQQQKPAVALIGNNPRPTADKPALLSHSMVCTLFHEFGHVMHGVCTDSAYALFSWTWSAVPAPGGVEYDFLEVPSMLFENWPWEAPIIKRLSSHFETHEKLPDDLIKGLAQSRTYLKPYGEARYLSMAAFDLIVHGSAPPKDPEQLFRTVWIQHALTEMPADSDYLCSWYHPVSGYDAGYFSYGVSNVYSADMFSVFQESKDIDDKALGLKCRELILKPGATQDAQVMLRNFLGREPSNKAFLHHLGLSS